MQTDKPTTATLEQLEKLVDSQLDGDMLDRLAQGSRGQLFLDPGEKNEKGRNLTVIKTDQAELSSPQFIRPETALKFSGNLIRNERRID